MARASHVNAFATNHNASDVRADELLIDEAVSSRAMTSRAPLRCPPSSTKESQALLTEADDLIVCPDKVAPADESTVAAVGLDAPKNYVCSIKWHGIENRPLFFQRHDGYEVEASPRQLVAPIETSGAKELAARERKPMGD